MRGGQDLWLANNRIICLLRMDFEGVRNLLSPVQLWRYLQLLPYGIMVMYGAKWCKPSRWQVQHFGVVQLSVFSFGGITSDNAPHVTIDRVVGMPLLSDGHWSILAL